MGPLLPTRIDPGERRFHQFTDKEHRQPRRCRLLFLPGLDVGLAHRAIGNQSFGPGAASGGNNVRHQVFSDVRPGHGKAAGTAFGAVRPGHSACPKVLNDLLQGPGLLPVRGIGDMGMAQRQAAVVAGKGQSRKRTEQLGRRPGEQVSAGEKSTDMDNLAYRLIGGDIPIGVIGPYALSAAFKRWKHAAQGTRIS
jgi:hypothetical protein